MHSQLSRDTDDNQQAAVRSWWSEEDNAFLAQVEGIRGSLIHGETEEEARTAALELAEEWREIEQWLAQLSVDDYVRFRQLDMDTAGRLRVRGARGPERRSLTQWNELLSDLERQ